MEEKQKLIDERMDLLRNELEAFWEDANYREYFDGCGIVIRFTDDTIHKTNSKILNEAETWFQSLPVPLLRPNGKWSQRYLQMAKEFVEEEYSAVLASECRG